MQAFKGNVPHKTTEEIYLRGSTIALGNELSGLDGSEYFPILVELAGVNKLAGCHVSQGEVGPLPKVLEKLADDLAQFLHRKSMWIHGQLRR